MPEISAIRQAFRHPLVLGLSALLFAAPLVGILGQFSASGFLGRVLGFPVLFWPGQTWRWCPPLPGWLAMGVIAGCYLLGIGRLLGKRALGLVLCCSLLFMAFSPLLQDLTRALTGWTEHQSPWDLAGKVDRSLFSALHNALWEEVVFRGLPLAILGRVLAKRPDVAAPARTVYLLVPSLLFALYHLPNHGPVRLPNTFAFGLCAAWLAWRHGFFAAYLLHFFGNAQRIWQLPRLPGIPPKEIAWLVRHGGWLDVANRLLLLAWLAALAGIAWTAWDAGRKSAPATDSGRRP